MRIRSTWGVESKISTPSPMTLSNGKPSSTKTQKVPDLAPSSRSSHWEKGTRMRSGRKYRGWSMNWCHKDAAAKSGIKLFRISTTRNTLKSQHTSRNIRNGSISSLMANGQQHTITLSSNPSNKSRKEADIVKLMSISITYNCLLSMSSKTPIPHSSKWWRLL